MVKEDFNWYKYELFHLGSVAAEEKEETYIESYDKRRLARNGSQILLSSRLP